MVDPTSSSPPDDLFARGMAAGRRAVLRELFAALDPFAREADGSGGRSPARFAPGVDPARLDRFLAATSGRKAEPSGPVAQAPSMPIGTITPSEPLASSPAPPRLGATRLQEPEAAPPWIDPVLPAERPTSPSDVTQASQHVADYVKQRGMEWWEKSKHDDVEPAVRAEARSIAAELFELAEELRRGDHLR